MQLGKSLSIALILLGLYLFYHLLFSSFQKDTQPQPSPSQKDLYHIGCYDIQRPLNYSSAIKEQLQRISIQSTNTSDYVLGVIQNNLQLHRVKVDEVTGLARQFEQYISTYQHIKSHNQYEQAYYATLRQTRQSFINCRNHFNSQPWNCRNLSKQYNQTDHEFNQLKNKLAGLLEKRNQHLNTSSEMLKDDDVNIDSEYSEKYNEEIQRLNGEILRVQRSLVQNNVSLSIMRDSILKAQTALNKTTKLLKECETNKLEIQYCKNISDYVTQIYHGEELDSIYKNMVGKRKIIELLKNSWYQSKKLGEDVSDLQKTIAEMQKEYQELTQIYEQNRNSSKCLYELQNQCQPEAIRIYEQNITKLTDNIGELRKIEKSFVDLIEKNEKQLKQFQKKSQEKREQMKNQVIDVDFLKNAEARKKQQVQGYRVQLNEIMIEIAEVKGDIAETNAKRIRQNSQIDGIMSRGEELIDCLGKKTLYLELAGRRPQNRAEDEDKKRIGSAKLRQKIHETLRQ